MLLNKETSNCIKNKINGNSYSNKQYTQYILELAYLEDYIKKGFKGPYFKGFTLDYLRDKYFEEYEVELTHMYVDNGAMQIISNPKQFDVIVTDNIQ